MALTIQHGFLPSDGTSVEPSEFLEKWITDTVITGLDATNFAGGSEDGLSFLLSQTDPPASSTRYYGLFWFQRGEGKLWVWDGLDQASQWTAAADPQRYRNGADWYGLSRHYEMWVVAQDGDIVPGTICYLGTLDLTTASGSHWFFRNDTEGDARIWHAPQPFRSYWYVQHQKDIVAGKNVARMSEMAFVALDTGLSGSLFRVAATGWVDFLAGSGTTGSAGSMFVSGSGMSYASIAFPGPITQTTHAGQMFFLAATDSSATSPTDVWLRKGFKAYLPAWGCSRVR